MNGTFFSENGNLSTPQQKYCYFLVVFFFYRSSNLLYAIVLNNNKIYTNVDYSLQNVRFKSEMLNNRVTKFITIKEIVRFIFTN